MTARAERLSDRPWTAERLRGMLNTHYRNQRVIVLANREPFIVERTAGGEPVVRRSAGGVVTALEPILRSCNGVWVAHGASLRRGSAVDDRSPSGHPSAEYQVRRVRLDDREHRGYYHGFSNEALWPLCHRTAVRPVYRVEDYEMYRSVNARFAAAVCEESDSTSPLVLVQDYHFALAPRRIRASLPRSTIVSFWHIPWPHWEEFETCPWARQLLEGLLGSTIVGFQTRDDCHHFFDAVESALGAPVDRTRGTVTFNGRQVLVRDYPISIEWPVNGVPPVPEIDACRRDIRRELGLAPDTLLAIGVDRLDYIKGLEEKFLAVERLLEQRAELRGRFAFAQIAEPSRGCLQAYRKMGDRLRATTARINARFGASQVGPIVLREHHHEPADVFRFMRAADVCYVGSLHDGMNLVAKEFVAARDDDRGVLVLSEFTGAARELTAAVLIDPHDVDGSSRALAAALMMPPGEQSRRMRAMRRHVREFNVYRWAGTLLTDAASARAAAAA